MWQSTCRAFCAPPTPLSGVPIMQDKMVDDRQTLTKMLKEMHTVLPDGETGRTDASSSKQYSLCGV